MTSLELFRVLGEAREIERGRLRSGRLVFDGPRADLAENGSLEQPFYRLTHGDEGASSGAP